MPSRSPLTTFEKERIYQEKLRGRSIPEIACDLGCSPQTVRKWWRRARDYGLTSLRQRRRGRGAPGTLSHFAPVVTAQAVALKRTHPRWGADRVLVELRHDPALAGLALPSRSRLALLFQQVCPALLAARSPRSPLPTRAPRPTSVHECWQLDCQEAVPLADDRVASICTIRDPLGAAILTAQAFDVTTRGRGRKLRWEEVRTVIRRACAHWETLPDAIQTDNEVCLGGQPTDPLPSRLTLWLVGLGVTHHFIRPNTPTDQAPIERTHRTLANFVSHADGPPDLPTLQQRLDREREQHNAWFPSRASDCARRPPLVAHPELQCPRRPYRVEWERQLFEEQRVYDYLATIGLERKVSKTGQIQLSGRSRSVGRAYASQTVYLRCDPHAHQWVVTHPQQGEIAHLSVDGIDVTTLTGLVDDPPVAVMPIQLTLPCLAA